LPIVLIDHPQVLGSKQPYGDEEGPYPDNWRRYALFARGVLESFPLLEFEPDVVQCMDWTTGLIPVIREVEYATRHPEHPAAKAGIFFSIHNLAMQGAFEREILPHGEPAPDQEDVKDDGGRVYHPSRDAYQRFKRPDRFGLDRGVGARHDHVPAGGRVRAALVFPGRKHPGEHCREQDAGDEQGQRMRKARSRHRLLKAGGTARP
jgi:hypothetical protein